jgi:hypothetical protein
MLESRLYYIYIDTHIHGAIDQLVGYFQANIFDADSCIYVLCKYYKDIAPYIEKKFKRENIPYKFIRNNKDLNLIKDTVVLYLFNAQSNCKLVANRNLTHIFVSHGESHKLASIKPILRIYDFIVTSGQVSIDRLLKGNIFSLNDISVEKKVITLGDTFIGKNLFKYDSNSESLLYAPTWEGGVPEENYSSLDESLVTYLLKFVQIKKISKIYIQPHPNIGHRDKKYLKYLRNIVKKLQQMKIDIIVLKHNPTIFDYLFYPKVERIDLNSLNKKVCCAITDISAMEMQLVHENIPTQVLVTSKIMSELVVPSKVKHLYVPQAGMDITERDHFFKKNRNYFFGYIEASLLSMTYKDRVIWLCTYAKALKKQKESEALNY